jgi:hypothetical protein
VVNVEVGTSLSGWRQHWPDPLEAAVEVDERAVLIQERGTGHEANPESSTDGVRYQGTYVASCYVRKVEGEGAVDDAHDQHHKTQHPKR